MSQFLEKIDAVRKAYELELYEPALALALTLPDICSAIENPTVTKVTERYIDWSNKHIFYENPTNVDENFAGAALYQLRCHFLHSGDSGLYKNTGDPTTRVYISEFELMKPKKNEEGVGELLIQASVWMDDQTQERSFSVKMGIRYIIEEICNAAEEFYDSWNDKAAFDDHVVSFTEYSTEINRTRGN